MQENICKKYDITREELQEGVERWSKLITDEFAGSINVLLAMHDLLRNGDVSDEREK